MAAAAPAVHTRCAVPHTVFEITIGMPIATHGARDTITFKARGQTIIEGLTRLALSNLTTSWVTTSTEQHSSGSAHTADADASAHAGTITDRAHDELTLKMTVGVRSENGDPFYASMQRLVTRALDGSELPIRHVQCVQRAATAGNRNFPVDTGRAPSPGTTAAVLDGGNVGVRVLLAVARGAAVVVPVAAAAASAASHAVLLDVARAGNPVYGFTVGVGLNKDRQLFEADGELTEECLAASREFQLQLLRSHSAGAGPDLAVETVRLAMSIRLNTLLVGCGGVQPRVVDLFVELLNHGVTPAVPSVGSVGEADIVLMAHIGLAMAGEGHAYTAAGHRLPAKEALAAVGIAPLVPFAKDALTILSSNAVSIATAILALEKVDQIVEVAGSVIGLSLEGMNGNIAPFLPQTNVARPYPFIQAASASILAGLDRSYLWSASDDRALQDPLSFRTSAAVLGIVVKARHELRDALELFLWASDDNPTIVVGEGPSHRDSTQVAKYFVETGGVIPSANFNVLPVVVAVEAMSNCLANFSCNAVGRCTQLTNGCFTGISRFLAAPQNTGHAFGAVQRVYLDLHVRTVTIANPVSIHGLPCAGGMEDTYTNLLLAATNLATIADNVTAILGIELFFAAQAVDIRGARDGTLALGTGTAVMHTAYRNVVPFADVDRQCTSDIAASTKFVATWVMPSVLV